MNQANRAHRTIAAKLKRRVITLPVLGGMVVVGLGLGAVFLVWALSFDLLAKEMEKRPRIRAVLAGQVYLFCELVGLLAAFLLWIVSAGGVFSGHARWLGMNATIQRWWTRALFGSMVWIYGLKLEVEGLSEAQGSPYLLFVRHSSMLDTILAAALIANPHQIVFRYVLKRELLSDPCLDVVGCRLPNAFIDRKARHSGAEVDAIRALTEDLVPGTGVLIYPEGTRFSRRKLKRARKALRDKGHDALAVRADNMNHVLPPRLAGPTALMEAAPDLDIVIMEHMGFEAASSGASMWRGDLVGQTIRVRVRRFSAPKLAEGQHATWLYDRWEEVDAWVESHS